MMKAMDGLQELMVLSFTQLMAEQTGPLLEKGLTTEVLASIHFTSPTNGYVAGGNKTPAEIRGAYRAWRSNRKHTI